MSNHQLPQNFKIRLRDSIMPKVEKVGLVLLTITIVFKLLHLQGFGMLAAVSLTTLAITYFLHSILVDGKTDNRMEFIVIKTGFVATAVVLVGTMFAIGRLPGAAEMLSIGTLMLGLSTIISFFVIINNEAIMTKKALVRFVPVLFLGMASYLFGT